MEWVIVTGGTRGIGQTISKQCLQAGFGVFALYKSKEEEAKRFKSSMEKESLPNLLIKKVDVAQEKEIAYFFEAVKDYTIVGLVNNAGTYTTREDSRGLQEMLHTNILGPFFMIRGYANYLRRGKPNNDLGAVVNIGSTSALRGATGSPLYAASKAALNRLACVLAPEYARENLFHINTIVCGAVDTEMLRTSPTSVEKYTQQTPTGRINSPMEIAEIVLWLIKNRKNNLVGSCITIDGGRIL